MRLAPLFLSSQGLFPHIVPDWDSGAELDYSAVCSGRHLHAEGNPGDSFLFLSTAAVFYKRCFCLGEKSEPLFLE